MKTSIKFVLIAILVILFFSRVTFAGDSKSDELQIIETPTEINIQLPAKAQNTAVTMQAATGFDPLTYTLGPDDVIEITVMRHPEFSGTYPINQEGKIQYKFVGDIDVNGLTKAQLEEKITRIISDYVISPEVDITITAYRSKVFYVLGEVSAPGKYYMRAETIPVREAVFEAGLPTHAAAMRKTQLITPSTDGDPKLKNVDLYSILYGGNLKKNIIMQPGDVLYVPSTVMAKIIRVISPVSSTVGIAASTPEGVSSGKTAIETLQGRPR